MKTLIITTLLFIGIQTHAQFDYGANQLTVSVVDKVTIEPEFYIVELVLSEKVNVNEETQLPESIEMEGILEKVGEKLEAYEMSLEDLELDNLWQSSAAGTNAFGGTNYSSSQKRLMGNRYLIEWKKSREKLIEFLKSLRFNGFDSAKIKPQFDKDEIQTAREKLLSALIKKARETATVMASAAERVLGKVKGVYENNANIYGYNNYNQSVNMNQNNIYAYNTYSISTAEANLSGKVETVSVTVTYELE